MVRAKLVKDGGFTKILRQIEIDKFSPSNAQSPKNRQNSLSYSFAVEMGHFDMVR